MKNKFNRICFLSILLVFYIFIGIFTIFLSSAVGLFILDQFHYVNLDRQVFLNSTIVKKIIIGGGLVGIAAWWVKTFGSGSKK